MSRPEAPRRRQILEALARELERSPERRITTARLAAMTALLFLKPAREAAA